MSQQINKKLRMIKLPEQGMPIEDFIDIYCNPLHQKGDFLKNKFICYIVMAEMELPKHVSKVGIAGYANHPKTRLQEYITQYGIYPPKNDTMDLTNDEEHQGRIDVHGIKIYFCHYTYKPKGTEKRHTEISKFETKIKKFYKEIAAPRRGVERFEIEPYLMAESVKSLINKQEVKPTKRKTRGVTLKKQESLKAQKEFDRKNEANPIIEGKRKRKPNTKYTADTADTDYTIRKFTQFRKNEKEVLVTWNEIPTQSWEPIVELINSYTEAQVVEQLSKLKDRLVKNEAKKTQKKEKAKSIKK